MENAIEIKNLTFPYVFNDFELVIPKNTFITISGPNSCGKTTLIRLLTKELQVTGTININEININDYSMYKLNKVIQSLMKERLIFTGTVYQEVDMKLKTINYDKTTSEILKKFKLLSCQDKKAENLKLYQQLKLYLIKIMLDSPKIILVDDIFPYLTIEERDDIINILKTYQEETKSTVIIFTTDLNISLYADKLIIFNNSKIVLSGKPHDILQKDNIINKIGLDLPFIYDLSVKLKDYNLIDSIPSNIDGLLGVLWKK